jgi:hypothetical protein
LIFDRTASIPILSLLVPLSALAQSYELQHLQGVQFNTPIALSYSPQAESFWGRTEYRAAFELIPSYIDEGHSFSRALRVTASAVLIHGDRIDWAIEPEWTVYTGGLWGKRLGASAIARFHGDRNHLEGQVGWSGATHSSTSNPAGILSTGFSYSRDLSGSRLLERLSPHLSAELLKATGYRNALFMFEGIEYQVTGWLSLDFYAQHYAAPRSAPDHRVAIGTTLNLTRHHELADAK